jgi:heat shock protein HtpX
MAPSEPLLLNTDFETAIAHNKRNTIVLIALMTLISAILGYVLGWAWSILNDIWHLPPRDMADLTAGGVVRDLFTLPPRPGALVGVAAMVAWGLIWGLITLFAGARILSAFVGARPANPADPYEKQFLDVVEEMALAAGVPVPQAMVVDTDALNAFASGYAPSQAMITATSGILHACTRDELQGVIGHEMGHVADYDVRYSTVVAAMAGVVVMIQHVLLDILRWSSWSGYGRRDNSRDGAGGARLVATLVVLLIVAIVAIVAPLAAKLVQLAISRQREYLADATSVKLTRNPVGLIHALQRLQQSDTALARGSSPVSALCIAPVRMSFENAFSTHPPLEDRIARLQNLGGIAGRVAPPEQPHDRMPDVPPPQRHGPWG